jgi:peptidoglycan/LPS O-acetylase OafA/YrhL
MSRPVIDKGNPTEPEAKQLYGRILELDGIRGIAIGLVLLHHFFMIESRPGSLLAYLLIPLRLAWSGVDLFFVLSGFLIGGILLDARGSLAGVLLRIATP